MRNKSVKNITYYKGNKYSTCNRQKKLLKKADGISYLLKTIGQDTQTIITSVDTLLFDAKFLEDVKVYKIESGQILE